jgi:hypothetical protein
MVPEPFHVPAIASNGFMAAWALAGMAAKTSAAAAKPASTFKDRFLDRESTNFSPIRACGSARTHYTK